MTHPTRIPDPIAELMRKASSLDEQSTKETRAAFLARVDTELPDHHASKKRYWTVPLALAAALALAWVAWPTRTISYDVVGAGEDGGYIRASASAPATLRFSDETKVVLTSSSRLRVVETDANGARLSLEQGQLTARVTHVGGTSWDFVAGPFHVHVTGTRFDLAWDPETERIQVDLHEGSVEIAGFEDSGPVPLRAGQRFVGDARNRTMEVSHPPVARATQRNEQSAVPASKVAASRPPPSHDREEAQQAAVADHEALPIEKASAKSKSSSLAWSALVSKGKFEEIVTLAEKRGVTQCLKACDAADLSALSDAARYTGRGTLAEQSLSALRSRFQGTVGIRAAFLLGRLYEGRGQMAQANTWYQTALRESPAGSYASESLAGKMRTVLALQGRDAAKPIAQDYLNRYPQGVHSAAAKKVLQP